MSNYLREVKLFVGNLQFTFPAFTIYFRVNFGDDPSANDAEIDIYNLSEGTINRIKKGLPIILNAGYQGDVGVIFLGGVTNVTTKRNRTDKITTITATDANDAWNTLPFKKTYKAGTKASQIMKDIITMSGLEIGAFELPNDITYLRPRTFNTTLPNAVKQVATDGGAKAHITKGKIFIRDPKQGDDIGFLLNVERGLIGTPERFESEEEDGYTVTSLLNYRMTTDSVMRIQSSTANGRFRAKKGTHTGSSREFYTKMEVVE